MKRSMLIASIFAVLLSLMTGCTQPQQRAKLEGVWEMRSQLWDGKAVPLSGQEIKLLTRNHFVWLHQDKKEAIALLAKKTERDSLMAYAASFGAGTYTQLDTSYTETCEFFFDPDYIGHSITFTSKVDGDTWSIAGPFPVFEGGKIVRTVPLVEVWQRIE